MKAQSFQGRCNAARLNLFLDDLLPGPENAELVDHLDRCESCRQTLERLAAGSRLWAELREMAPDFGPAPAARPPLTETVGASPREVGSKVDEAIPLDFLGPPATFRSLGRLGPYDVTEVLGRGAFGVVLKAFDPALSRFVAIKVLASHLAVSAAARGRFAREARGAAAVVHENVVAIHAVDSWNGLPYLVMPCIAGPSLQERVDRDGPLAVKEVLRVGMQAALGLAAAHDQGLVHRDVKPSNILLENGVERVKLSDFGLARAVDDASLTQSGVLAGTPQYMSPEQARGEAVDHRSDLFSLGGVLYFMCTGHAPFRANSTPAVLRRVCDDRPRPLREVNPDVPEWLAEVVGRLLAKEPDGRFATAAEVARVLKHHLAELQRTGVSAPLPPSSPGPLRNRGGRKASVAYALTAAAVLVLVMSGMPGRLHTLLQAGSGLTPKQAGSAVGAGSGRSVVPVADDRPSDGAIVGSGQSASKVWNLTDFTEVTLGSTFRAEITKGDGFKVTTSSDDNVTPYVRVVKEGKTLKLSLEPGKNYRLKEPLKVEITLPVLERLEAGGSAKVALRGFRSERDFQLRLHGASKVDGTLEVGNAEFRISGASTLDLTGSAKAARLSASGASHLQLAEFSLSRCEIELEGASNARLKVRSNQPFRARLSGASHLDGLVDAGEFALALSGASRAALRGSAKDANIKVEGASHLDIQDFRLDAKELSVSANSTSSVALQGKVEVATLVASGASHLRLGDLVIEEASVKLSGSSQATVDVRKSLKYELSAGARLEYSGTPPNLTGLKSRGASLRQRP